VLALQDHLAYGPTFESAMAMLFGTATPSGSAALLESGTPTPKAPGQSSEEYKALVAEAGKDLSEYQRLTSEGKLGEAGQKLEQLKHVLDELNSRSK